ncbi:MAG TPA: hypothetical protein VMJ10_14700 [Kofleriaceae bacterium]|nr:hypothetical protein [Kofleriaceae bacterium]
MEYFVAGARLVRMRALVVAMLLLAARAAHADPPPGPVVTPMIGPYPSLSVACAQLEQRYMPSPPIDNVRVVAHCRAVDRFGASRVLVTDIVTKYVAGDHPSRSYALALPYGDKWWVSAYDSVLDLTGATWGASNCCDGRAGTPRYYIGATHAPNLNGDAFVLRTELPVWRVLKRDWPRGADEAEEPPPHERIGEYLVCGTRDDEPPACYAFEAAHCSVHVPRFSLTGAGVKTWCADR